MRRRAWNTIPGVLEDACTDAADVSEMSEKLLGERKWRGGVTEDAVRLCERSRDIDGSGY
jgi:hypothetical protein